MTEEKLVKSLERVRDLGEVFTPAKTVNAILDLLPIEVWEPHPSPTFLEPACGDGNFLCEILTRKLRVIEEMINSLEPNQIYALALEAVSSLYGVDISPENILGGDPDHPVGARERLLKTFQSWFSAKSILVDQEILDCATWLIKRNILVGNMLEYDENGNPTSRDNLEFFEYVWSNKSDKVSIKCTKYGDLRISKMEKAAGIANLFGDSNSRSIYDDDFRKIHSLQDAKFQGE